MSFSKNRKRSGIILAGVTTASMAASAASQGFVRALPSSGVATSLAKNVSGENVKNVGSSTVNFLKDNYGWIAVVVIGVILLILKWDFSGGDEKKGTVTNMKGNEEKGFTNKPEKNGYSKKKECVPNPFQGKGTKSNFKYDDIKKVNNSLNVIDDEENIFKNDGKVSNSVNIIDKEDEMNNDVKNGLKYGDEVSNSLKKSNIIDEDTKDAFENLGEYYMNGG